ncbi:thiamine-phosphate kinase [Inquilinus sp. NPDC058860]|uniref:thiamine-phosphate kinase n=1 Tax=Inquilinus sp. NPDC058860 TaxID=3346652 RepID=UPI0036BEB713
MGLGEFERIDRYFRPLARATPGALGLADDAALLDPGEGRDLVVTTDALVETVHYLPDEDPARVAQKLLRSNLSDLAAKGAAPLAYTLTLALPAQPDESWIERFVEGLAADQALYGIGLLGGDSVRTPGTAVLSVTAFGTVPQGAMLRRSGARPGDDLYVSGTLGDAALGLRAILGRLPGLASDAVAALAQRHRVPEPRMALGQALIGLAHAAMDVSDGLPGDLPHLCAASGVAAEVELARLPLSDAARAAIALDPALQDIAWGGGEDYELLFSAPASARAAIETAAAATGTAITRIGRISAGQGARLFDPQGRPVESLTGWRHF